MLSAVDDMVMIQNNGERFADEGIQYNRRFWKLPKGKKVMVPAAAAFLYFGDPRSTDTMQSLRRDPDDDSTVEFVADRATEVRRLRHLYGAGIGDESCFDGVENLPDIQMFDMEGNEITTILVDPSGETTSPASITRADQSDLRALVERQQRQIDAMREAMDLPVSVKDEEELPADDVFSDTPPVDQPPRDIQATTPGGEVTFNDPTFADPNAP